MYTYRITYSIIELNIKNMENTNQITNRSHLSGRYQQPGPGVSIQHGLFVSAIQNVYMKSIIIYLFIFNLLQVKTQ